MVAAAYIPDAGDLVWLNFDPQAGHEQAGYRPALVLSSARYNGRSGMAVACPITSRPKGYNFEVPLPAGLPIAGVVLADHVKSIDWEARRARRAGKVSASVLEDVRVRVAVLIGC